MRGQNPRSRYMTYAEQLEVIQSIPLREGDRKVIQCPFCYGQKKLALSKSDGKLMWNCYRASCNAKGIHTGRRNLQSVKNYLNNKINNEQLEGNYEYYINIDLVFFECYTDVFINIFYQIKTI